MASSLKLRFITYATAEQQITIKTGSTYTFKPQRTGLRQVSIYDPSTGSKTPIGAAINFKDAYEIDDNYYSQSTLYIYTTTLDAAGAPIANGGTNWIVQISNIDSAFFDGFLNNTDFITSELTTTDQEAAATLTATLSQSPTNPCGKFLLNVGTNVKSGRIVIEIPVGNLVVDIPTDISGAFSYNLDRLRVAEQLTGIVKLYNTEFTGTVLKSILFNPPAVLSILSVDITGSPFGAIANIQSTSGFAKTYSLNGINYKSSSSWGGLLAGSFTAYVEDEFGCEKTKAFIVTEDQVQGLTVPERFEIPKHNSHHFVDRSQKNFLGHIAEEIPANAQIKVFHDHLQTDIAPDQFKSSFKNHTVKIFGCGTEEEITVIQKSNNINRLNIYAGNLTAKNGKLAVHFTSGNIYESDGITPKAEGHILNGLLPIWYKAGVFLSIENIGVAQISNILYENDIAYAVTNLDPVEVINTPIASIHSEHPYEVFEFDVLCNRAPGTYIITIDNGKNEYWSEVLRIQESLNGTYLKVKWWNEDLNDQIIYSTGIRPFRRIKYDKYFTFVGQNERETHDTDTSIKLINSKSKAIYELDFRPTAMEMAHGLIDGLNHASHIDIDGAVFICNSAAKTDPVGNWYFVRCELALIGQTMESIEADFTQINVQFLKVGTDVSGVGFLQV